MLKKVPYKKRIGKKNVTNSDFLLDIKINLNIKGNNQILQGAIVSFLLSPSQKSIA